MFLSPVEEQTGFDLDGKYCAGLPYEDSEGGNPTFFPWRDVQH